MAVNFPASLDEFVNPAPNQSVQNPSHAQQHSDANDAIEALQEKVGVDNSTDPNSLDYRVATLETASLDSEEVQDIASTLLTAGVHSGITVTYRDIDNRIDLATTYGDEQVLDAVANALTAGSGITKIYNETPANYIGEYDNGYDYQVGDICSTNSGSEFWLRTGEPNTGYPPYEGSPYWTTYSFVKTINLSIDTNSIATQSYVNTAISNLIDSAPGLLDTLNEIAAAIGDDANFATTINNAIALKAPIASPAFTGTPTAPTATAGTNNTQIATTAFVTDAVQTYTDGQINALTTDSIEEGTTSKYFTDERAQDAAAALFNHLDHSNVSVNYDDQNNKIVLTVTPQLTQEQAQDYIAPLFSHANHTNMNILYDDEANQLILEAITEPSKAVMSDEPPANPADGAFWLDTNEIRTGDVLALKIWNAAGNKWEYAASALSLSTTNVWTAQNTFNQGVVIGLNANPANPLTGQVYYNLSAQKLRVFDGLVWKDVSGGEGGGGGLPAISTDGSATASSLFFGLIEPPTGAALEGDIWFDIDDDAGETEFIYTGPTPPENYGLDTLWIDTDEPELPLIYSDNEPPSLNATEGDLWIDLDDTSGQSILSSATPPSPSETEFWLDLSTEEGQLEYKDLFKNGAGVVDQFSNLPSAVEYPGITIYVTADRALYVSDNQSWKKVYPNSDAEALGWIGF